jgi:gluconokinase
MTEQLRTVGEETQDSLKPQLLLLSGPAGTGKSTIGKLLSSLMGWKWVDADDWHSPESRAKMAAGQPLDDSDRFPWLDRLNALGQTYQNQGLGWILSCSALKQTYRQRLCLGLKPSPMVFWLQVSRPELQRRLELRNHPFFPPSLLDSQLAISEMTDELIFINAEKAPEQVAREIWDRVGRRFPSANT